MIPCASLGDARLDTLTRVFAMDLLLDPAGVRALAAYWVAVYVDRPVQVMPGAAFCSLLEALALGAPAAVDVALIGHERDAKHVSYVLRLFAADLNLALTHEFLVRSRRWRAIRALAAMLWPPKVGQRLQPTAFQRVDTAGLRGELQAGGFVGNDVIAFFYNPLYFCTHACAEFTRVLVAKPVLQDRDMLRAICGAIQQTLRRIASTQPDEPGMYAFLDLSETFGRHATDAHALHAALVEYATARNEEARADGVAILRSWRTGDTMQ